MMNAFDAPDTIPSHSNSEKIPNSDKILKVYNFAKAIFLKLYIPRVYHSLELAAMPTLKVSLKSAFLVDLAVRLKIHKN